MIYSFTKSYLYINCEDEPLNFTTLEDLPIGIGFLLSSLTVLALMT